MSSKQRSKKTKPGENAAPDASTGGGGRGGPSTLAIAIAILGLAALVFALVVTGDPPERRRRSVAVASSVDRWAASPERDVGVDPERDFTMGPEDAPVTIVEFSDFECPYCNDAAVAIRSVYERYPGDVRLVFKNYPLDQSCNEYMTRPNHLYACRAAAMARCAGLQGKFWEMHDAIYELDRFTMTALDALPEQLDLSMEEFTACMQDDQVIADIQEDIETGQRLGVQGTPTIYINGRRAPSPDASTLASIVEHVSSAGDETTDGNGS